MVKVFAKLEELSTKGTYHKRVNLVSIHSTRGVDFVLATIKERGRHPVVRHGHIHSASTAFERLRQLHPKRMQILARFFGLRLQRPNFRLRLNQGRVEGLELGYGVLFALMLGENGALTGG